MQRNILDEALLGRLESLDSLFESYRLVAPVRHPKHGSRYPRELREYFLGGLPGSIDIRSGKALTVAVRPAVIAAVQPRCCNGVIGSFEAVKSVWWEKHGLLPIFAWDSHSIAHPLVALVPFSEHERFADYASLTGV